MKLLRVLLAALLGAGFLVSAISTGIPEKPKESMALASDASRTTEIRASRSTNMFVSVPPITAGTSTSTSTTSTSTTIPPPKRQDSTAEVVKVATSDGNDDVVSIALAQVGKAYRSGATGPNAFDCSGLVDYVFNQAGIHVPRLTAAGYFSKYPHVSQGDLQPGNVVEYRGGGHIAIYVGDGMIVSASTPRGGVKHVSLNEPGHPTGFARL